MMQKVKLVSDKSGEDGGASKPLSRQQVQMQILQSGKG